eukprot:2176883-Pleurochrysis_carterae.AAC.2
MKVKSQICNEYHSGVFRYSTGMAHAAIIVFDMERCPFVIALHKKCDRYKIVWQSAKCSVAGLGSTCNAARSARCCNLLSQELRN